jgi:hypothetical protein
MTEMTLLKGGGNLIGESIVFGLETQDSYYGPVWGLEHVISVIALIEDAGE